MRFQNRALERLEVSTEGQGRWPAAVVKAFRRRMQFIRAMPDERDLRAIKANHFEKMQGDREGQHSVRLNEQFRLLFCFEEAETGRTLVILEIADPH